MKGLPCRYSSQHLLIIHFVIFARVSFQGSFSIIYFHKRPVHIKIINLIVAVQRLLLMTVNEEQPVVLSFSKNVWHHGVDCPISIALRLE